MPKRGSGPPTIDPIAMPGIPVPLRDYWSSTTLRPHLHIIISTNFYDGTIETHTHDYRLAVRLVRSREPSDNNLESGFPHKIRSPDKKAWNDVKDRYKIAELKYQQLMAKSKNALLKKDVRQLFELADQTPADKSLNIEGRQYTVSDIYKFIIRKHAKSEYSVRATEKLSSIEAKENLPSTKNTTAKYVNCIEHYVGEPIKTTKIYPFTIEGKILAMSDVEAVVLVEKPTRIKDLSRFVSINCLDI